jgi:hypothetical protein
VRDETEARAVLELMMLPVRFAGLGAMGVLLNGNGLAIARAVIGPLILSQGATAAKRCSIPPMQLKPSFNICSERSPHCLTSYQLFAISRLSSEKRDDRGKAR